ncbi:MAG: Ig-like domain-containing protein [Deltaproteobacteria bacterium]|nr:Ig-like domain-containing protein [Deltaproteobacteria bacterium]
MKRTACLAGLLALACSCTQSVKTVTVDPEAETLGTKGARATFRAILKDAQGQRVMDPLPAQRPKWTSSAPLVATVDETGRVTAQKSGEAVITATVGELKAEGKVKVSIPATVIVTPATLEFKEPGKTASLEVKVADDAGNPLAAKGIDWDTSEPKVARVVGGRVSAMAPGKAVITATLDVIRGQAEVTVKSGEAPVFHKLVVKPTTAKLKKGSTVKLSATALDKKGKPVADVPVTWTSSNPKVAAVAAGAVTAEKKGNVKITAAAGKKTATAKVTVK